MRKIFILILLLPCIHLAGQSGYKGKKIALDATIQLKPFLDMESSSFALGYGVKLNYAFTDNFVIAPYYTLENRSASFDWGWIYSEDYAISEMGIDMNIMRRGYPAPCGKAWIIGFGTLTVDYDAIKREEYSDDSVLMPSSSKERHTFLKLGHETRTPIKNSNIYWTSQFAYRVFVSTEIIEDPMNDPSITKLNHAMTGKLGFGVFL